MNNKYTRTTCNWKTENNGQKTRKQNKVEAPWQHTRPNEPKSNCSLINCRHEIAAIKIGLAIRSNSECSHSSLKANSLKWLIQFITDLLYIMLEELQVWNRSNERWGVCTNFCRSDVSIRTAWTWTTRAKGHLPRWTFPSITRTKSLTAKQRRGLHHFCLNWRVSKFLEPAFSKYVWHVLHLPPTTLAVGFFLREDSRRQVRVCSEEKQMVWR